MDSRQMYFRQLFQEHRIVVCLMLVHAPSQGACGPPSPPSSPLNIPFNPPRNHIIIIIIFIRSRLINYFSKYNSTVRSSLPFEHFVLQLSFASGRNISGDLAKYDIFFDTYPMPLCVHGVKFDSKFSTQRTPKNVPNKIFKRKIFPFSFQSRVRHKNSENIKFAWNLIGDLFYKSGHERFLTFQRFMKSRTVE